MAGTLAILLTALAALAITLVVLARRIVRSRLRPSEITVRTAPCARTRVTRTMTGKRLTHTRTQETRSQDEHVAVSSVEVSKARGPRV